MDRKPQPFPKDEGKVFELALAAEPTLLSDLDKFITLSHLRDFESAQKLFDKSLKNHQQDALLVEIEYADHLLQRGNYADLSEYLESRIALRVQGRPRSAETDARQHRDAELPEELHLFCSMKSLGDLYRLGALRPAIAQARKCREFLSLAIGFPSNIQVCQQFHKRMPLCMMSLGTTDNCT